MLLLLTALGSLFLISRIFHDVNFLMFKRSRGVQHIVLKLQDEWTIGGIVPLKQRLRDSINCVAVTHGPTRRKTTEEIAAA